MIHNMNLAPSAFGAICLGQKTVEMRLYDEKRAKINVGDEIIFENTVTHQKIRCVVTNLARYNSFFELYSQYDKVALGYSKQETANAKDMYAYYSAESIERYGVLAIELKLL